LFFIRNRQEDKTYIYIFAFYYYYYKQQITIHNHQENKHNPQNILNILVIILYICYIKLTVLESCIGERNSFEPYSKMFLWQKQKSILSHCLQPIWLMYLFHKCLNFLHVSVKYITKLRVFLDKRITCGPKYVSQTNCLFLPVPESYIG